MKFDSRQVGCFYGLGKALLGVGSALSLFASVGVAQTVTQVPQPYIGEYSYTAHLTRDILKSITDYRPDVSFEELYEESFCDHFVVFESGKSGGWSVAGSYISLSTWDLTDLKNGGGQSTEVTKNYSGDFFDVQGQEKVTAMASAFGGKNDYHINSEDKIKPITCLNYAKFIYGGADDSIETEYKSGYYQEDYHVTKLTFKAIFSDVDQKCLAVRTTVDALSPESMKKLPSKVSYSKPKLYKSGEEILVDSPEMGGAKKIEAAHVLVVATCE